MAKRENNENTVGEILKGILQDNRLQTGVDEVVVRDAWRSLMGNGVNTYTRNIVLKNGILYVELTSAVLRAELSFGKDKIVKMINDELRRDVVQEVVLR
ncbi:MAG: DUF721 domain-containing protein [Flavobacterium sp.]